MPDAEATGGLIESAGIGSSPPGPAAEARRLRQALIEAQTDRREDRLHEATEALAALQDLLTSDGLWSEDADGTGPARAETLCELLSAFEALAAVSLWAPGFSRPLDLS